MPNTDLQSALAEVIAADDGCQLQGASIAFTITEAVPPYLVDLDRCQTADEVLGWIVHLSAKNWIKTRQLRTFVHLAATENGITIQYPH